MANYKSSYTGTQIDAGIGKANTAVQPEDLGGLAEKDTVNYETEVTNKPTIPNISGKEDKINKVTSISSSSTDTQYPTAKAVYDLFNSITDGDEVLY